VPQVAHRIALGWADVPQIGQILYANRYRLVVHHERIIIAIDQEITRAGYNAGMTMNATHKPKGALIMDVNKKLVEYHLNRLKDKRSDVRLDAIHELSELGDPDALEALREVVEKDSDVQVRKAAQAAAIIIFRRQQGSS
jgi:hypothetical protein